VKRALLCTVLFYCAIVRPNHSAAEGALAIALPPQGASKGFSYGLSVNAPDAETAVSRAIEACRATSDAKNNPTLRGLCKLIQKFKNQCGTDAMDPKAGTPGVGWAVAATRQKAEAEALAKCRATAGAGRRDACEVPKDATRCDGSAQ
jgi:Domain of unknown function (DUF4189)